MAYVIFIGLGYLCPWQCRYILPCYVELWNLIYMNLQKKAYICKILWKVRHGLNWRSSSNIFIFHQIYGWVIYHYHLSPTQHPRPLGLGFNFERAGGGGPRVWVDHWRKSRSGRGRGCYKFFSLIYSMLEYSFLYHTSFYFLAITPYVYSFYVHPKTTFRCIKT